MNTVEVILGILMIGGAICITSSFFIRNDKKSKLMLVIGDILLLPGTTINLIDKANFLNWAVFTVVIIGAILFTIDVSRK